MKGKLQFELSNQQQINIARNYDLWKLLQVRVRFFTIGFRRMLLLEHTTRQLFYTV